MLNIGFEWMRGSISVIGRGAYDDGAVDLISAWVSCP